MNPLFTSMALLEAGTGVALAISPPLVAGLVLGAALDAPVAVLIGRFAGAALLALGLACWLARDDGRTAAGRGIVAAMLLYNAAAVGVLAHAGLGLNLSAIGIWPAAVLHAALALWCVVCLREGLFDRTAQ